MLVCVAGAVRVVDGDNSITVEGREAAVLAVLALYRRRPVSVYSLVDALWAAPPPTARKAVQNAVSRLRSTCPSAPGEASLIERVGDGYRLGSAVAIDVEDWESQFAAGLDSVGPPPSHATGGEWFIAVHEWPPAIAERARLQAVLLDAEDRWAAATVRSGRGPDRLDALSRLADAEPYRESRWAVLVTALAQAGRQAEALDVYQRARRILVDDLGLEPGPLLRQAERDVLEHAFAPTVASVVASAPRSGQLIGRERELRWLADFDVQRATAGPATARRWSWIRGDAGIGKTRLAAAVAEARAADGGLTVWAQLDGEDLALRRLVDAVEHTLGPLGTLDTPEAGRGDIAVDVIALAGLVAARLDHAGRERPLTVVVDDLQTGGPDTVRFLRSLERQLRADSVSVVLTSRSGEDSNDEDLASWLAEHRTRDAVLDLGGLDAPALATLVGVAVERAETLRTYCGGNPLHALELARTQPSIEPLQPPATVTAMIERRVANLGRHTYAYAIAAATCGVQFDPAVAAAASGLGTAEVALALDRLTATGLVAMPDVGAARFAHPLTPAALVAGRQAGEVLLDHVAVWLALRRGGGADPITQAPHAFAAAALAEHRDAALHTMEQAAARLAATGAWSAAASWYQRCLLLVAGDDRRAAQLRLGLGTVEALGDVPGFKTPLLAVATWAESVGDRALEADALCAANRIWPENTWAADDTLVAHLARARMRAEPTGGELFVRLAAAEASERFFDPDPAVRVAVAVAGTDHNSWGARLLSHSTPASGCSLPSGTPPLCASAAPNSTNWCPWPWPTVTATPRPLRCTPCWGRAASSVTQREQARRSGCCSPSRRPVPGTSRWWPIMPHSSGTCSGAESTRRWRSSPPVRRDLTPPRRRPIVCCLP